MTSNAVAVRTESSVPALQPLQGLIESRRESIAAVLPNGMSVERFLKVTWLAIAKNPDLMKCTPQSILASVIEAAEIGLEPTGSLSRAWLIPYDVNVAPKGAPKKYEKQAQLQIGYQGLADLARNSGNISKVESRVVYAEDRFEVVYGTTPRIVHEPAFGDEMAVDHITFVYAVAFFKDGSVQFDVMTRAQVDAIRARSRSGNFGPWVSDWPEMARKTVVRRLMKSLPLSPETQQAVERDIQREVAMIEAGVTAESRSSDVKRKLLAKVAQGGQVTVGDLADVVTDAPPPTDAPGDALAGEVVSEPAPDESASQPQQAGVAVCGDVAPDDGLMAGAVCNLKPGHASAHKNESGSWPK